MDDDRPCGTLPSCAFILVIPATVIETSRSCKELWILLWIVIHHEQNLAPKIDILEIIPLELGGLDTVSDEDNFCVLQAVDLFRSASDRNEIIEIAKGFPDCFFVATEDPFLLRLRHLTDHRKRLSVGAEAFDRLEPQGSELRLEIELRQLVARRGRPSSLKQIVGKKLDMPMELIFGDFFKDRFERRFGRYQGDGDEGSEASCDPNGKESVPMRAIRRDWEHAFVSKV